MNNLLQYAVYVLLILQLAQVAIVWRYPIQLDSKVPLSRWVTTVLEAVLYAILARLFVPFGRWDQWIWIVAVAALGAGIAYMVVRAGELVARQHEDVRNFTIPKSIYIVGGVFVAGGLIWTVF